MTSSICLFHKYLLVVHSVSGRHYFQPPTQCLYSKISWLTFFFLFLFRATPVAYGGSLARGGIGIAAAGLHNSHSNTRSKLHHRSCSIGHRCGLDQIPNQGTPYAVWQSRQKERRKKKAVC